MKFIKLLRTKYLKNIYNLYMSCDYTAAFHAVGHNIKLDSPCIKFGIKTL